MLVVPKKIHDEMIGDAKSSFPDECCGFFFGNEKPGKQLVTLVHPVFNSKEGDKRKRFEISPRDYLAAERLADERGLSLLGVYHSHPNHPAVPSEHDRVAAQPAFSYIIISVNDRTWADTRSWRLNDQEQFEEETIIDQPL